MSGSITLQDASSLATREWLLERDKLLETSARLSAISNDWEFEAATELVARFSNIRKALEKTRKEITSKFDAAKKEIMAQERELAGGIDSEYARLREAAGAYATGKAAEREAAERARREALAEREMAQEAAQEAFGGDAVLQQPAAAAPFVPDRLKAASGRRQVVRYVFEIVDPTVLDRKFLSPDDSKIRAFVNFAKAQGIKAEDIQEPGLRVTQQVSIN